MRQKQRNSPLQHSRIITVVSETILYLNLKDWNVQEIRFEQLEEFKNSLRGRVTGIKTRRNILNGLHAFFNWMRRKGVITEIPVWPL